MSTAHSPVRFQTARHNEDGTSSRGIRDELVHKIGLEVGELVDSVLTLSNWISR